MHKVLLNEIAVLQKFIKKITPLEGEVLVRSEDEKNHSRVNGKSLLGLLTLNLTRPVFVEYFGEDEVRFDRIISSFC